jgi:hypothetical protein
MRTMCARSAARAVPARRKRKTCGVLHGACWNVAKSTKQPQANSHSQLERRRKDFRIGGGGRIRSFCGGVGSGAARGTLPGTASTGSSSKSVRSTRVSLYCPVGVHGDFLLATAAAAAACARRYRRCLLVKPSWRRKPRANLQNVVAWIRFSKFRRGQQLAVKSAVKQSSQPSSQHQISRSRSRSTCILWEGSWLSLALCAKKELNKQRGKQRVSRDRESEPTRPHHIPAPSSDSPPTTPPLLLHLCPSSRTCEGGCRCAACGSSLGCGSESGKVTRELTLNPRRVVVGTNDTHVAMSSAKVCSFLINVYRYLRNLVGDTRRFLGNCQRLQRRRRSWARG